MDPNKKPRPEAKVLKDDEFFHQKSDLKIILIGDSAVGKSK